MRERHKNFRQRWLMSCLSSGALVLSALACGDEEGGDDGTAGDDTTAVTGNAVRGGALYDTYWAVSGVLNPAEPTTDHPLWASRPDLTTNTRTGADTWRCKECHGWDYKGSAGQYATGSHATGIKGVFGTALTAADIVAALKDPAGHNYAAVLTEQDLADVALFVKEKTLDTATLIDATGAFIGGDGVAGETAFAICATCHGADGTMDPPVGGTAGFEDFPGVISRDNPWEFIHKVRFGQPGTTMTPMDATLDATGLANLGAYVQTLP